MGRLLADISKKMEKKVQKGDSDPLKILVHSTHDTAIAALCSTLDVFDEQWALPQYDIIHMSNPYFHLDVQMASIYRIDNLRTVRETQIR